MSGQTKGSHDNHQWRYLTLSLRYEPETSGMWRRVAIQWTVWSSLIELLRIHQLGCGAMWVLYEPTFRMNISLPSSGWKESANICQLLLTLFLACWFCSPLWWRRHVPPKCRFLWAQHNVTPQKTVFIVTTIKTSILQYNCCIYSIPWVAMYLFMMPELGISMLT
jgi:hypothetical protein